MSDEEGPRLLPRTFFFGHVFLPPFFLPMLCSPRLDRQMDRAMLDPSHELCPRAFLPSFSACARHPEKDKMVRLGSHASRSNISSAMLRLSLLLIFVLTFAFLPAIASATAPPTGENAYCGKGDVPRFGDKDGPADLPKSCYYTGLDGTPSPGKQIQVAAKADLADAINSAKCGDTLLLPAGAAYEVTSLSLIHI